MKEGTAYRTLTIECAGLLPGSTAARVAAHVKIVWERGQQAVAMLREELGVAADTLVPLVQGGVTMAVARKVRGIRDDAGKDMYGAEERAAMQATDSGWQDFLCGNQSSTQSAL